MTLDLLVDQTADFEMTQRTVIITENAKVAEGIGVAAEVETLGKIHAEKEGTGAETGMKPTQLTVDHTGLVRTATIVDEMVTDLVHVLIRTTARRGLARIITEITLRMTVEGTEMMT